MASSSSCICEVRSIVVYVSLGVLWRDILKVAKNFLGPEMPLSVFWRDASEEAKRVLGYLVAKNFLGFLCVNQNDTYNLFLLWCIHCVRTSPLVVLFLL